MNPKLIDWLTRSSLNALALDLTIKATLVLAAAGLTALSLRRSSAAARHLAWCLGLGAALAMLPMTLALPGWSWRVLPAVAEAGPPIQPTPADSPTPRTVSTSTATHSLDGIPSEEESPSILNTGLAGRPSSRPTTASTVPSWRSPSPSWSWLWAVWLSGVLIVLSAPIAGRIALRRWAREAERINESG
jgi:hypothetical protein